MSAVLDMFLMQPFGARSLLQRIFGMAISDGIMSIQKSIDILISQKIEDSTLATKIKQYTESDADVKEELKEEAKEEQVDILVCIMRSAYFEPAATPEQIETVHKGFVAWQNVVENVSKSQVGGFRLRKQDHLEMRHEAELFAHLKQLLKLYMRQRDKAMMLQMIEEVRHPPHSHHTLTTVAQHAPPLPRPLPDLLRAARARLQVGQRVQQHPRLGRLHRRHHPRRRGGAAPGLQRGPEPDGAGVY